MNFINLAMIYLLDLLHTITTNYGLAIIALTVLIRVVLWPLNSSQMRSMRKMQELQPKLKALQEKHKDNPQKMQESLMKFYAENKFNPLAGCLPLLIQLPIFIGLYGAVNSPIFLAQTVGENFLFINNLSHTLQTHAGEPLDNTFAVKRDDKFATADTATVTYQGGQSEEWHVNNIHEAVEVSPKPVFPGEPMTVRLDLSQLGLSEDYQSRVESVDLLVVNETSRELERVTFQERNGRFASRIPTTRGETKLNIDVLALILIYGILTVLYQRVMTQKRPGAAEGAAPDPQAQMMKWMPLMFVGVLFFIPIPAGVMLYLVATTALMFIQTAWVNFRESRKDGGGPRPSDQIVDVKAE